MITELERRHRRALARELTAAAQFPLRDRYGFAATDETVDHVVAIVFGESNDQFAADAIGLAVIGCVIELAADLDMPTTEDYERGIVAALRALVADRAHVTATRSHS